MFWLIFEKILQNLVKGNWRLGNGVGDAGARVAQRA